MVLPKFDSLCCRSHGKIDYIWLKFCSGPPPIYEFCTLLGTGHFDQPPHTYTHIYIYNYNTCQFITLHHYIKGDGQTMPVWFIFGAAEAQPPTPSGCKVSVASSPRRPSCLPQDPRGCSTCFICMEKTWEKLNEKTCWNINMWNVLVFINIDILGYSGLLKMCLHDKYRSKCETSMFWDTQWDKLLKSRHQLQRSEKWLYAEHIITAQDVKFLPKKGPKKIKSKYWIRSTALTAILHWNT